VAGLEHRIFSPIQQQMGRGLRPRTHVFTGRVSRYPVVWDLIEEYHHQGRQRSRPPRQRKDEEWQAALRRVLQLPAADQLRVLDALAEEFGGPLWKESERVREARLRVEALATIEAAAIHLGLPSGTAPTITEFKRAAREIELPMTFNAVYEAFESRWEIAKRFYRREHVPATAAQRRVRRSQLGTSRGSAEHPLTCLRRFLNQEPPPVSVTLDDYTRWAKEMNERLPAGWDRLLEEANNIRVTLATTWEGALEVARGTKTLEEARAEALSARLAEAGPLVGAQLAGWMLGRHRSGAYTKLPDYPQPVVQMFGLNWLWRRSDIEAYGQGCRDFDHERSELQGQYVNSHEIAARLGITQNAVRSRIDLFKWHRVPRPAGKAGKHHYWWRSEVERWFSEHGKS